MSKASLMRCGGQLIRLIGAAYLPCWYERKRFSGWSWRKRTAYRAIANATYTSGDARNSADACAVSAHNG